jgi:hypothetical protein
MEKSLVPKVVRWKIFLQSFDFLIKHIPGKYNSAADFLSRNFILFLSQYEFEFEKVHNSLIGHFGIQRTYALWREYFPDSKITMEEVKDFVAACPICQKNRSDFEASIKPIYRHLKPEHLRTAIGIDHLSITPEDTLGNNGAYVIVVYFSKLVTIFPTKNRGSDSLCDALIQFISRYGLFDEIHSDPGSEILSEAVASLNEWLGVRHVVSLVNRPQSNGVEGSNKQIIRHLKAILLEKRLEAVWSSPRVISTIEYVMNSSLSSESGVIPYHAHFGSFEQKYFIWPENELDADNVSSYVLQLNDILILIRDISRKFQLELVEERIKNNDLKFYKPGSLILKINDNLFNKFKIETKYLGPLEVISQHKNDVTCKHLSTEKIYVFHISKLKYFIGSKEDATKISQYDSFEFKISSILDFKGVSTARSKMFFKVCFDDNSIEWINYKLIKDTIYFEKFCSDKPFLKILLLSLDEADKYVKRLKSNKVTSVRVDSVVFINLRSFDEKDWFHNLNLPNVENTNYFYKGRVLSFENKSETKISVLVDFLNQTFVVDNYWLESCTKFKLSETDILVNKKFAKNYPMLLNEG